MADAAAVKAAVERLVRDIGAPDLLVNNAGFAYLDYIENVTEAHLRDMTATNLFGCYHTVRAVVPHMKAGGGTIVNVSSVGGRVGYFGAAAYCAHQVRRRGPLRGPAQRARPVEDTGSWCSVRRTRPPPASTGRT